MSRTKLLYDMPFKTSSSEQNYLNLLSYCTDFQPNESIINYYYYYYYYYLCCLYNWVLAEVSHGCHVYVCQLLCPACTFTKFHMHNYSSSFVTAFKQRATFFERPLYKFTFYKKRP
jgi:hypothetical protein